MKQPDMVNLDRPEKFLKIDLGVKERKTYKTDHLYHNTQTRG